MTTTSERYQMTGGDVMEVTWDGNVWTAPSCGAQYATREDAMRQEIQDYLRSCGEDADADAIDLDTCGEWEDEDTTAYRVEVVAGIGEDGEREWTTHSHWDDRDEAQDQADMGHGRVVEED